MTSEGGRVVGTPRAPGPESGRKDGRTARRPPVPRLPARPEVGVLLGALAVLVFFLIAAPSVRQGDSMATVLCQSSTIGIMALPVALLMIGGEFDLSSGVAVITSALTASSFGQAKKIFASSFGVGGVQVKITVVWWLVYAALVTWLLLRTRYGNGVFAVGGSQDSARAVGVPVFTKITLFMLVGFGAWFVGMHNLFSFDTVQSGEGVGNELIYIAAAVIGGCLLTGGQGSAIGPLFGAFMFGMVNQGIVYAGWNPDWFKAFLGVMPLGAVLINLWVQRTATGGNR
ncbi:hypothetical protein Shyhy01_00140 [Streptomyces hygroscopicus subsp. hygroscopicus]|nr:ABC transporter permease [Streptomyces hygroscopicus]GLX47064.1 hypothetical protein Shyhy01_00140 [Streptomyces hygroscopicus subsp. hygroscopicus]